MKQSRACAILSVSAFCFLLLFSPLKAHADTIVTLELTGVGSNQAGIYDAYPYYFSVNGGPGATPLMCLGYYNGISFNESWTATVEPISAMSNVVTITGSPATAQTFAESVWEEAAWLYNDANVNPANSDNDQLAAWGLFSGESNVPGSDNAQLTAAQDFVAAYPNSDLYSDFVIYVPLNGWPAEDEVPQVFIGYGPEPSSLILLGSGLLGIAGFLWRRRHSD
ncbi:MAG: PEP-CTERM sorting domain-containing protein [Terracidiphilus sp.]